MEVFFEGEFWGKSAVGGGICEVNGGVGEAGGVGEQDVGGFEVAVGTVGVFSGVEESGDDLGEEVAEVVAGDVDAGIEEGLEGAFVFIDDGVGTRGAIGVGIGMFGGDLALDGGEVVDGGPVLGIFGEEALGFMAEEEGVDFEAEVIFGPEALGGLEDFEDAGLIGGEEVERADTGEVEAIGGLVWAKGGQGRLVKSNG